MAKESGIQSSILQWLEKQGHAPVKIHAGIYTRKGTHDVICCVQGRFVALEVKKPGEQPTLIQQKAAARVLKSGGVSERVTSLAEVQELVQKILNGAL